MRTSVNKMRNFILIMSVLYSLCYCLSHPTTLRWHLYEGILSCHPQGSSIRNFYGSSSRFSHRFDAVLQYSLRLTQLHAYCTSKVIPYVFLPHLFQSATAHPTKEHHILLMQQRSSLNALWNCEFNILAHWIVLKKTMSWTTSLWNEYNEK